MSTIVAGYLGSMKCRECGNSEKFSVHVPIAVEVVDGRVLVDPQSLRFDWDDDLYVRCPCGESGDYRDFYDDGSDD